MKTPTPSMTPSRNALILAGSITALFLQSSALAVDYMWDGGSLTDDLWGSGANWLGDIAPSPGSGNSLIFAGTTRLTPQNDYGDGDDFQNITFDATAGAFTIGNTGTNGIDWFGSIINNSSNLQTIAFRLYQSASNTISAVTGDITLNSSALIFRNGQAFALTAASGRTIQIDSVIADGGGAGPAISVNGAGTVDMRGANTFTSGTTLSSGTLAVGNNSALGTGTLTSSGAAILQASGGAVDLSNAITLGTSSALTLGGANNLTLSGSLTQSGGNRTLTVSNTGTTTISGPVYLSEASGSGRTLTLTQNGALTVSGAIANFNGTGTAGNLTVNGSNALTLSGNNTYSGATTLSSGTVNVNSATAFGTSAVAINGVTLNNTSGAAITLTNNNTYTLGGNNIFTGTNDLNLGTGAMSLNGATRTWTVNGGTLTVGGNLTGGSATIGLTKAGAGTLKLAGAANGSIGALTINGGVVDLGTDLGHLGTTLVAGSGGTINTSGGKLLLNVAAGDLGVANGGTLTVNAVIANGTQNSIDFWNTTSGTGVVVLTAANTFSGTTNLQSGIVSVATIGDSGVAGNLGTNATFNIGATNSTATLRYTGTGETNNRVLNLSGTTGGATVEQAGTGLLKFTSNLTATGGGNKTLTLTGSIAGTGELAGNIVNGPTGATTVTKTGTGTWTLSGSANSYTGGTRANAGTLIISGTLTGNAFLSVNNVGASNATLKIVPGANIAAFDMPIGEVANSRGAVYHSGGSLTLSRTAGVDVFKLGTGAGSYGYYQLSGSGSLTLNELGIGGSGAVNNNAVTGVFDMTGGTITNSGWITVGRGRTNSSGLFNMTGGAATFGAKFVTNWATTAGGVSVANIGGGAGTATVTGPSSAVNGLDLTGTSTAGTLGVVNLLTNGTLTTGIVTAGQANPTAILNFNGGTLKATATNAGAGFLNSGNIDAVTVYSGGGTIDNSGTSITVGNVLAAATGNGVSSIAVTNGGSGYIGAPLVTITGGTGNTATGYAVMADDGTGNGTYKVSSIVISSPGTYTVDPTGAGVTLTGGGATTAASGFTVTTAANTSGGMTFTGTGTTTLSGTTANTYTGLTTVNAGRVSVAKTAGVNAIAGNITVGDGIGADELHWAAGNQVASTSNVTLTGGTLLLNGNQEGATTAGVATTGLGTLTLTANSFIDFGAGSLGVLAFADSDSTAWTAGMTLEIRNWNGVMGLDSTNGGGGTEALFFGADNAGFSAQLAQISFLDPAGFTGSFSAGMNANGEVFAIAPIPETGTLLAAFGLLGLTLLCGRRRNRRDAAARNSARCGGLTGWGSCAVVDVRTT